MCLPESFLLSDLIWTLGMSSFKERVQLERIQTPKELACVSSSATLTEVVEMIGSEHVHQIFVVSKSGRPVDCISLTDIIRFIASTPLPRQEKAT